MISAQTYVTYVAPALVAVAGVVLLLAFGMLRLRQAHLVSGSAVSTFAAAAMGDEPKKSRETAGASLPPVGSPVAKARPAPARPTPVARSEARRILVTGGAGFIGSALVRHLIRDSAHEVLNLDKLTYAGSTTTVEEVASDPRYRFVEADICDGRRVAAILAEFRPDVVAHLAAESHVDRSIDGPDAFIETNIVGTYRMLRAATAHWQGLDAEAKGRFRFHHISTDEVFGSLGPTGLFTETTPYDPRSPYSASKASSDHLVRAWHETYGLPTLVTNCSNNYGPYHFPEKLIPLMILKALAGETLPVYGRGDNVRDWLFVEDHVRALRAVFERGRPGETYNVGGNSERTNLTVVETICRLLDEKRPRADGKPYADQIGFVADRPGHDMRYAIDASKLTAELGWEPRETFETGIARTVEWYLANEPWWRAIQTRQAVGDRLGLKAAS